MSAATYTIRPGLLVALHTTMTGNVTYRKSDEEQQSDGKGAQASWKMERTIADVAEHERGKVVRSAAVYTIRKVCVAMPRCGFLLCPDSKAAALDVAIAKARDMVAAFNASAKESQLHLSIVVGTIERDSDSETVRAITTEMDALVEAMQTGRAANDVAAVKAAVAKAKALAAMLTEESRRKLADKLEAMVAKPPAASTVEASTPTVETSPPAELTDAERALAALKARKRSKVAA